VILVPKPEPLPGEGDTYGLAEAPKAEAPATPQPKSAPAPSNCPSCGSALLDNAVLCVLCGHDLRTGQKLEAGQATLPAAGPQVTLKSTDWKAEAAKEEKQKKKKKKKRRSRSGELPQAIAFLRGCAVAFACSMIGVFIWWVVAYFTWMESGYIALILGGLTGMGMMIGYGHEDALPGIASAVIAFVAIVVAKVVVFFSIIISIAAGIAGDMAEMAEEDFAAESWDDEAFVDDGRFAEEGMPGEEMPGGEAMPGAEMAEGEMPEAAIGEAGEFADEDFDDEFLEEDIDLGVGVALGAAAFFWVMFGFWDILWILIACGMAYKVGSGGQWWED